MAAKKKTTSASAIGNLMGQSGQAEDRTTQLLRKAQGLLADGKAKEAFDLLNAQESGDPRLKNARGVCLLRLGLAEPAIRVFRGLCLTASGIVVRNDVPLIYKTNFAAALLLDNRVSGCLEVLNEVHNESHPSVQQLRGLIANWQSQLTLWQRVMWKLGNEPKRPVSIDVQLGDLEEPQAQAALRAMA